MRSRPSPWRMSAWMSASNKIATWWLPYYHTISLLLKATNNPRKERIFISLKCEVSVIKRFIFKLNVLIIIKSSKKAQRLLSKGDSIPLPSPAPPLVSAHFTPTRGLRHRGERVMSGRHRGDPSIRPPGLSQWGQCWGQWYQGERGYFLYSKDV